MLIGLISDTHIRVPGHGNNFAQLCANELPPQIKESFQGVDLILHAGDVYSVPILDELGRIAPILAAEGDDDPFEIMNDKRVKWRHIITIEGVTICLTHQYGLWHWDEQQKPPDIFIFGHSHKALLENHEDAHLINPGSPTFPQYRRELGTIGLLTVNSGKAEAQTIQLQ
jgi:putative phosphoesterase